MPVHVALLRAVNVGGTGSLPMADLKTICEGLGFADVKTYIQSGNVLFRSDLPAADAAAMLDSALQEKLGKAPGVMIRTGAQLQAIADQAPFPDAKPNLLLVVFLREPAPSDALDKLVAPKKPRLPELRSISTSRTAPAVRSSSCRPPSQAPRATSTRCASLLPWRLRWKADAPQGAIPDGKPRHTFPGIAQAAGWKSSRTKDRSTSSCCGRLSGCFSAFDRMMPPSSTVETISASWSTSSGSRGR